MADFLKQDHVEQAIIAGKAMIYGGGSTTFGAKMWAWLGENNEQITSVCSILGAVVCIAGFALNIYLSRRRERGD